MFDSNRYYEVDRLGPIFLAWNMVVVKNEKGKIKEQKYKIKDEKVRSNLNLLNIFLIILASFDLGEMETTISGNNDLLVSRTTR